MKERPILFSGPMVRALLAGTKTQTRRVVKSPFLECLNAGLGANHDLSPYGQPGDQEWRTGPIPETGWYYVRGLLAPSVGGDNRPVWVDPEYFTFGFNEQDDPEAIELDSDITPENVQWKRPGDRLWVRETWAPNEGTYGGAVYRADHGGCSSFQVIRGSDVTHGCYSWKPSIHMPRWASRLTLEVAGIRVERVQDISEEDARAEGCFAGQYEYSDNAEGTESAVESYRCLWESINGPGSWNANPWVWVVEFKVVKP